MITRNDVTVIGAGPSGIFAGIALSKSNASVSILERGNDVNKRHCIYNCQKHHAQCNITNGVGGAGLFSDICIHYSNKVGGNQISKEILQHYQPLVDNIYARSGLSEYKGFPEREFLQKVESLGFQYADVEQRVFGEDRGVALISYLKSLWSNNISLFSNENALKIKIDEFSKEFVVDTESGNRFISKYLILATGQHGHSLIQRTCDDIGISVTQTKTTVGFRIETLYETLRPVTEKFFNWKIYGKTFRTFCVNNYGKVVIYQDEFGHAIPNGSHNNLSPSINTNLAIVAYEEPERVYEIMRQREDKPTILQRWEDFEQCTPSTDEKIKNNSIRPTCNQYELGNLQDIFDGNFIANFILDMNRFEMLSPGLLSPDLLLYGPEAKFWTMLYPTTEQYESLERPRMYFVGDVNAACYAIALASIAGYIAGEDIVKKEKK